MTSRAINATEEEPWVTQFKKENEYGESDGEFPMMEIILKMLLDSGDDTRAVAATAAKEIDTYYQDDYLHCDPLLRFSDDKGWGGFLWGFWNNVWDMARLISYNDPSSKHDRLVKLLLELRKLPQRSVTIYGEDCVVWIREPVATISQVESRDQFYPPEFDAYNEGKTYVPREVAGITYSLQEHCDHWLNYSCFLARMTQAGLNDRYDDCLKSHTREIWAGVLPYNTPPPELLRECQRMTAAQTVLILGRKMAQDCFSDATDRQIRPEDWKVWTIGFGELSKEIFDDAQLTSAIREAHKLMVSLCPDGFLAEGQDGEGLENPVGCNEKGIQGD